jgi:hypothetical protein
MKAMIQCYSRDYLLIAVSNILSVSNDLNFSTSDNLLIHSLANTQLTILYTSLHETSKQS